MKRQYSIALSTDYKHMNIRLANYKEGKHDSRANDILWST